MTPETLLEKNSWIVWRGGLVEDFELVLDYRVSKQGNSGIGYRLAVLADDPFSVRGPQADIHGLNMFTGICYEENGRRLLAARGQSTWIDDPGGQPRLIAYITGQQAALHLFLTANTVRQCVNIRAMPRAEMGPFPAVVFLPLTTTRAHSGMSLGTIPR